MSTVLEINDINFDNEVLQFDGLVLVEFGAVWCGPCKRQRPILEQFAQTHTNVKVALVDIDDSPVNASNYGVRAVPTIILFKNGKKVNHIVGLTSLKILEDFVNKTSE